MADVNGSSEAMSRAEWASENAMLKLVARWMMALGVPLIILSIGALGWFVDQIVTATDDNTKATIKIEATLAPLVKAQDAMVLQIESNKSTTNALENRINIHAGRLSDLNDRNRDQDVKIDDLQRRVWRMPEPPINTVPPPPSTNSIRVYP